MGSSNSKNNLNENINVSAINSSGTADQIVKTDFDFVKISVIALMTILTLKLVRQVRVRSCVG
jgi:hypothetical protein